MAQINRPDQFFNTVLYTGDGNTTKAITGVGFQPDLVWGKTRSDVRNHQLIDSIRGVTKTLQSNVTNAELSSDSSGFLASFDSDGFTTQEGSFDNGNFNVSGRTYVAWNFLAGGTASSNTDGDITSQVSANTTSGFSIVSYTGDGNNNVTVGHGLGQALDMVIIKSRDTVSTNSAWGVWHKSEPNKAAYLDATDSFLVNSFAAYGFNEPNASGTYPTSTVFYISGSGRDFNSGITNENTKNYIAYCFAEKKGFSKFGSYTGNGSADGTFVYTGFKPAFVMVKRTDSTQDWRMFDSTRSSFNAVTNQLKANQSDAETTTTDFFDFLSNGFKIRESSAATNASGGTYIYMAFAENPLVGSNNVCATAR